MPCPCHQLITFPNKTDDFNSPRYVSLMHTSQGKCYTFVLLTWENRARLFKSTSSSSSHICTRIYFPRKDIHFPTSSSLSPDKSSFCACCATRLRHHVWKFIIHILVLVLLLLLSGRILSSILSIGIMKMLLIVLWINLWNSIWNAAPSLYPSGCSTSESDK